MAIITYPLKTGAEVRLNDGEAWRVERSQRRWYARLREVFGLPAQPAPANPV